jgi:hypothetical protein
MVTIKSVPRVLSVALARLSACARALIDGAYDEMAGLNTFSAELAECVPVAWKGIELERPVPIHHILGRFDELWVAKTSLSTSWTHVCHSQDRYSEYSSFFLRCDLRPRQSFLSQNTAPEADS